MAADDDVAHLQFVHGKLDNAVAIEIHGVDDVADVSVHKDFARQEPHHLVGGDAAVRAADPQVGRILLGGESVEDAGVVGGEGFRPATVAFQEGFDVCFFHGLLGE